MFKFLKVCHRNVAFKTYTYGFLKGIYKIRDQMQGRLLQHQLKMKHLEVLYKREVENMTAFYISKGKRQKKNILATKLIQLNSNGQDKMVALLKEYFKLCKMLYRIRCTIAYNWNQAMGENQLETELDIQEDSTFDKMIQIVHTCLVNCFGGTDKNHQVVYQPLEANQIKKHGFKDSKAVKDQGKKLKIRKTVNFYD